MSARLLGSYAARTLHTVLLVNGPAAGVDQEAFEGFRGVWEQRLGVALKSLRCASERELAGALDRAGQTADAVVVNPGAASLQEGDAGGATPCVLVGFPGSGGYLGTGDDHQRLDEISGRGVSGYYWAVRHLIARSAWPVASYGYGDHDDLRADLRLPTGDGPHPVAVLIHGGGWKHRWQRDLMAPMAVDLALRGFATWNIEFRRVGGSGGWPATFDDVAEAIAALGSLGPDSRLDLDRVCFLGHSSGGHLALWAGAAQRTGIRPLLVVSISGIPDLAEAARRELIGGENIASRLLGGGPDEVPERYAACSPAELLPLGSRQLLVQGLADYIPDLIDLNRTYARSAARAGDSVRLIELPAVEHLETIEPATEAWQQIAEEVEADVWVAGSPPSPAHDALGADG